jgi:YjbE family integral membrane protein
MVRVIECVIVVYAGQGRHSIFMPGAIEDIKCGSVEGYTEEAVGASLPRLLVDGFSIVVIDLLLAGDNALVIALAVRSLPARQRRTGMIAGAATAVLLRVLITFVAVRLLDVEFIKLAGGAFVLWIAVKVFTDTETPEDASAKVGHLWQAVWYIVFADITMSADNVLAIAGASHGSLGLIIFGLGLSIPLVVMSSNLLVMLLNRYPWTLYLGAAILGEVGADMMLTDGFVTRTLHPSQAVMLAAKAAAVAMVLIASRLLAAPKES